MILSNPPRTSNSTGHRKSLDPGSFDQSENKESARRSEGFSIHSFPFSLENLLFYGGLCLKIVLCFAVFQGPLAELFVPFFETIIRDSSLNPWQAENLRQFPYGSFLFFLLYLPCWVGVQIYDSLQLNFTSSSHFLGLIIQSVLLLADLSIYFWGRRKLRLHPLRWIVFYWLNPVLMYVSYIHGQLDVVSMALLLWSAQSLVERRWFLSGLLMALALQCKFHVLLTLPLFLIYIWNQNFFTDSLKIMSRWLSVCLGIFLLLSLPVWKAGESSLQYLMFSSPEAQRVFALQTTVGNQVFLWGIFGLLLVMTRLIISTRMSALGFIFALGQALAALLFITNPSPGWFFWMWPFFAAFLSRYPKIPWLIPVGCVMAYFIHFLFGESQGLFFWTLTTCQLTVFLYLVLQEIVALRTESPALGRGRPIFVGISGDSGAGKDSLTEILVDVVGSDISKVLAGDNYHRWERGAPEWNHFTHLDPRANRLSELERDMEDLRQGKFVEVKEYDHHLGVFKEPILSQPMRYIFSQGLHAFFTPSQRRNTDLRIFLEPEETLRRKWKIERDLKERGHSPDRTRARMDERIPDANRFFPEQKHNAHWLIRLSEIESSHHDTSTSETQNYTSKARELVFQITLEPQPALLEVLQEFEKFGLGKLSWAKSDSGQQKLLFVSKHPPQLPAIQSCFGHLFPLARPITRGRRPPQLRAGYEGLVQLLFISWLTSHSPHSS